MVLRGEDPHIARLMEEYDGYEEAASELFEKFVAFDVNNDCNLDYEEANVFFQEHGLFKGMPAREIDGFMKQFFSSADEDGNGALDFAEFVKAHAALVKYRRENCLPALEKLTKHKLVLACKRAKEKYLSKQQAVTRKSFEEPHQGAAKPRKLGNHFVDRLARQRSTQLLKQAFYDVDYQKTGKVALEDFQEQMSKLGYIKNGGYTKSSFFSSFATTHPMLSEVTFDIVLQIMFPDLSSAQRRLLDERVKLPSKSSSMDPLQEVRHFKEKRLSKSKSLTVDEDTRRSICQIFKGVDDNDDDVLDVDEFIDLMTDIHSEEECEELFHQIDTDGSGTLNVWEFVAWWTTSQKEGKEYLSDFKERLLCFAQSNYHSHDSVLETCLEVQCALTAKAVKKDACGYC
uniref:EF-hand domain-containing protein n=1 Tax=Pyramimonas obovata TaxID=1411642 RepID=A0A7S0RXV1_9CHLO|mmetsp:Transcript_9102/g.18846  ORF Transcript_9102/g.18846 Transcript_9102/m.18846 type:complete len:401 (+) Transcript_9102:125-1327(+)|eukprot:CAMPEP_0118941492 /NCGR_PEP_ID=MMETSP1169-20130426/33994_1 /TAXON_ID=36882 /ORGANISM="Pyramimonas obovata, Strain CCMP722" /LENGTH=400 /DNA_ID=CAMNT_0006886253 /DNA_START=93 /DNA_END=1295 /DNA_ORIENTATION=-